MHTAKMGLSLYHTYWFENKVSSISKNTVVGQKIEKVSRVVRTSIRSLNSINSHHNRRPYNRVEKS